MRRCGGVDRRLQISDKATWTKAEIDRHMKVLTEAKKAGQFRAFWKDSTRA